MLREIAKMGPLKSIGFGDTTVGMTIEHALGITPNSSQRPDFKGIEIKATRGKPRTSRETRQTLFACVPDWGISNLKSSAQILSKFGYWREMDLRLYCTVSALSPNSQGLMLEVDQAKDLLKEIFRSKELSSDVAVWRLDRLEAKLASKHRETFWVRANAERINGVEWFQIESVTHTTTPNLSHLQRLLADGGVTVDHLIKRRPSGRVSEKGPLFKIVRPRIPELFYGIPRTYDF